MRRAPLLALALIAVAVSCGGGDKGSSSGDRCGGDTDVVGVDDVRVKPGAFGPGTLGGQYYRHVPRAYDGTTPVPLVVFLHGYGQSTYGVDGTSGLADLGERQGFITVVPGIEHGNTPHWDDTLGSADQAWLGALLDRLTTTLCVDPARVYVAGVSNGAMMTSTLACAFADRIAAVAPVAGLRDPAGCTPARPVPIITVHGTDDETVAYDGGFGPALAGRVLPDGEGSLKGMLSADGPSVPDMASAWAMRNGCSDGAYEESVGTDMTRIRWSCPAGHEVEILRYEGFPHVWRLGEVVRGAPPAIDQIWAFFAAHPLVTGP